MSEHGQVIHLPVRNTTTAQTAPTQSSQKQEATVTHLASKRQAKPYQVTDPRMMARAPLTSVPTQPPSPRRNANDPVGNLVISGLYQEIWTAPELSKTFKLFAAPSDLLKSSPFKRSEKIQKNFDDAIKYIAGLKNYYGHAGFNHHAPGLTPEEAFYKALKNNTYNGEWVLPTDEMLNILYKNRHRGQMRETFTTSSNGMDTSHIYASCTSENSEFAKVLNFSDGNISWNKKDAGVTSLRLIRLEPC
jgi:hypothetical protein